MTDHCIIPDANMYVAPSACTGQYAPPWTVTNGYTCPTCGQWVANGTIHACLGYTSQRYWQCSRCGQWVFGFTMHVCAAPAPASICLHCYCIDVPPSGERTKLHARCCKCADVRVKE